MEIRCPWRTPNLHDARAASADAPVSRGVVFHDAKTVE
jgi:hypothetical protein